MKVLFAVSDENISESIVKEYQKQYKEILTYKNVYYFNAIIKELQKDKSYDRIVISEDLEPFASNNFDSIDKFIFEKLDSISDEAIDDNGKDTQIILITTERRTFGDEMLVKLFGLGIYSALIGKDKSIENVCELIRKPRNKRDAKIYYKVDADSVKYQTENENDVSETEIQNILSHYKKISQDKYVSSFNNIVSQYTDSQLRIIINFLPVGVKAVLEADSPKYQELVMTAPAAKNHKVRKPDTTEYVPQKPKSTYIEKTKTQPKVLNVNPDSIKIDMIENRAAARPTKPVVIPTEIEATAVKKVVTAQNNSEPNPVTVKIEDLDDIDKTDETFEDIDNDIEENELVEEPKKGRGRPRKYPVQEKSNEPKKGRGRPRKYPVQEESDEFKKEREIPKKYLEEDEAEDDDEIDLFGLDEEDDELDNTNQTQNQKEEINLFDLEDDDEEEKQDDDNDEVNLFDLNEEDDEDNSVEEQYEDDEEDVEVPNKTIHQKMEEEYNNSILQQKYSTEVDLTHLLTRDKKVVSFVGTTKNGTSFIVNNLAELLSSMGISTAILDMTQSRNAYYIYTNNEERLRKICENSINNLRSNIAEGIKVNKNLTVYTPVPGTNQNIEDVGGILTTLIKNYSLVLIDCDFNTPVEYFHNSQEIYLIQSMDVLTIQPLTAFLRDLKSKGILEQSKIKIVINKEQRVSGISPKVIIGGMAYYNDPSMSFMTELFNRDNIKYLTIPLELQNYSAYLESLVNCKINLKSYTKTLNIRLRELANMVYPLINQQYGRNTYGNGQIGRR